MTHCFTNGAYAYDPHIQVLWSSGVDAIEDVNEPTETELDAAENLTENYCLSGIVGWEVQSELIDAPAWTAFTRQRVGIQSVPDARLIFASDRQGLDVRTVMSRLDRGFIVLLPSGLYTDHPDAPLNVYPVRVAQITQFQRLAAGGSQLEVAFAVRGSVGENVNVAVTV